MDYPKYLYKYRNIDIFSEEIICHNTIYLSSPTNFNDPFDSSSDLIAIPTDKDEAKTIYENLDEEKQKEVLKHKLKSRKENDNEYDYYAHLIAMGKEIESKLANIGICCFSEMNDNILTWSHYANNHKGICIEFKPDYSKYPFNLIQKIDYSEDKPSCNYSTKDISNILKIKYKDWDYENEFRIIDQNNFNVPVELNPDEVSGVIFGYKTPKSDIEIILTWIKRSNSLIARYKASKTYKKYKLTIDYYKDRKQQYKGDLLKALKQNSRP